MNNLEGKRKGHRGNGDQVKTNNNHIIAGFVVNVKRTVDLEMILQAELEQAQNELLLARKEESQAKAHLQGVIESMGECSVTVDSISHEILSLERFLSTSPA